MSSEVSSEKGYPSVMRLRKGGDFKRAFDQGVKVVTPFFVLVGRANEGGSSRLGVIASKKVGKAVTRNVAKRLIREVFRLNRPLVGSVDVVIIARRRLVTSSSEERVSSFLFGISQVRRRLGVKNSC